MWTVGEAAAHVGLSSAYFLAIVAPHDAEAVLEAARSTAAGEHAALVGEVLEGPPKVSLRTGLGATRPLIMLAGDQLPRIC